MECHGYLSAGSAYSYMCAETVGFSEVKDSDPCGLFSTNFGTGNFLPAKWDSSKNMAPPHEILAVGREGKDGSTMGVCASKCTDATL